MQVWAFEGGQRHETWGTGLCPRPTRHVLTKGSQVLGPRRGPSPPVKDQRTTGPGLRPTDEKLLSHHQ